MNRSPFALIAALLLLPRLASTSEMTLDAILQRTVEKNPEIVKAKLELEQASGRRLIFRSVGLPNAIIGATLGDQGGRRAGKNRISHLPLATAESASPFLTPRFQPRFDGAMWKF